MDDESNGWDSAFQLHWKEVYSVLLVITRQPAVAEELAQDVFLLAIKKNMRPGPEMTRWFKAVARRLAMNELRRKRPSVVDPSALQEVSGIEAGPGSPSEDSAFEAELPALRECIKLLPESDRGVLAARYEHDISLAEIAASNGQSAGYMKQRLFRLRKKLEECIQQRMKLEKVKNGRL